MNGRVIKSARPKVGKPLLAAALAAALGYLVARRLRRRGR